MESKVIKVPLSEIIKRNHNLSAKVYVNLPKDKENNYIPETDKEEKLK